MLYFSVILRLYDYYQQQQQQQQTAVVALSSIPHAAVSQHAPDQQSVIGRSAADPAVSAEVTAAFEAAAAADAETTPGSIAATASELADLQYGMVHAVRLGCVLHILRIAITAGLTSVYFVGAIGEGPWNDWERDHPFSLLGLLWYNLSRANSSNATWEQYKNLIANQFPDIKPWTSKFVKPAETRWMVVFDGAAFLNERWEQVAWLFCTWASSNLLVSAYNNYWAQSAVMLEDGYMRILIMFTARLGELLFLWAYRWLCGEGGFFLRGEEGGVGRRLSHGMRLVDLADFSLLFL